MKLGLTLKVLGLVLVVAGIGALELWWQSHRAAGERSNALSMHRQNAGVPGPDGWFLAESTEGGYSVETPLRFNDFTIKVKNDAGDLTPTYCIGSKSSEGITLSAVKYERKLTAQQLLDDLRKKDLIVEANTRIFDVEGGHAVEWLEQNDETASYIRTIDFASYSILLGATYPRTADGIVAKIRPRFFDSLKIKSPRAPAKPAGAPR